MGYDMEMEEYHEEKEFEEKELEKLKKEIMDEAKKVVDDYVKNPSDISGSTIQIHETSPFMKEEYKGTGWKKIIHTDDMEGLLKRTREHNKKLVKKKKK